MDIRITISGVVSRENFNADEFAKFSSDSLLQVLVREGSDLKTEIEWGVPVENPIGFARLVKGGVFHFNAPDIGD